MPFLIVCAVLLAGCGGPAMERTAEGKPKGFVKDGEYVTSTGEPLCPVMEMVVASRQTATGVQQADGVKYYLCCDECVRLMKASPSRYIKK
jgi:YHS domain-containing protein